jgi:hypothetical protein
MLNCTNTLQMHVEYVFLIGTVRGGIQLGPLGTVATNGGL